MAALLVFAKNPSGVARLGGRGIAKNGVVRDWLMNRREVVNC